MSNFFCECKDSGEPPCFGLVQLRADLSARDAELAALTLQFSEMRRRWQLRDLYATQQEERAEEAERERDDERTIVNRIWEQLGAPSYASLSGRSIYDLIAGLQADRDEWKRKAEEAEKRARAMRELALDAWYCATQEMESSFWDKTEDAIRAAIAARGGVSEKCPRCQVEMEPGKAMETTWAGMPEWPGDTIVTMSPSGPGKLIDCIKCPQCGFSRRKP